MDGITDLMEMSLSRSEERRVGKETERKKVCVWEEGRGEVWASQGQHKRKAVIPVVTRESRRAPPRHAHGDLTSLAPHERLPEILVVPREKTPTGAAARGSGLGREWQPPPLPASLGD